MSKPQYLMESDREGQRLKTKSDWQSTERQLIEAGLLRCSGSPVVADVGTGVGFVAKVMGELLSKNYDGSELYYLDQSENRLCEASEFIGAPLGVRKHSVECDLAKIPLPDGILDFAFCRFVFEYLADPLVVLREMIRITKPGGKIVVADLDYNCLTHYPIASDLERQLLEVMNALSAAKYLDAYVGRKLFSFFRRCGLLEIRARVEPHHLFYGELNPSDEYNWSEKVKKLIELQDSGAISLSFSATSFAERFMSFLKSEERFTYTPVVILEGVKP